MQSSFKLLWMDRQKNVMRSSPGRLGTKHEKILLPVSCQCQASVQLHGGLTYDLIFISSCLTLIGPKFISCQPKGWPHQNPSTIGTTPVSRPLGTQLSRTHRSLQCATKLPAIDSNATVDCWVDFLILVSLQKKTPESPPRTSLQTPPMRNWFGNSLSKDGYGGRSKRGRRGK